MVDPVQLASDILDLTLFFAMPASLWLLVYLLAWEQPRLARRTGFDRRVFWLLVPGSLAGTLANAPVFTWAGSVLALNVGGAIVPFALCLYLPSRWLGRDSARVLGLALAGAAAITALLLAEVLLPSVALLSSGPLPALRLGSRGVLSSALWLPSGPVALLLCAATVLLAVGSVDLDRGRQLPPGHPPGPLPSSAILLPLASALGITFVTTEAVPGIGIVSVFPYYLAAPLVAGLLALLLVRPWAGLPLPAGVPFGFSASTLGVVLGADVLHQPPLYAGGPGILSVGGAGLLDLVYLSGLLTTAVTILALVALRRPEGARPEGSAAPEAPSTPRALFRSALARKAAGDPSGALRASSGAVERTLERVRLLRGGRSPPASAEDLGLSAYDAVDLANLRALADRPGATPVDAERGLLAAHLLLRHGLGLERSALASVRSRVFAFLIDLALLTAPAVLLWGLLALSLPGDASTILSGVPFNTALFGYAAYGFLYFVATERWSGATIGKRVFGLEVRRHDLRPAGTLRLLVRNTPRLVLLTLLAELVGTGLLLLLAPAAGATGPAGLSGADGLYLIVVGVLGVLVVGGVSVAAMGLSPERERIGDLWAGTWVINRSRRARPPQGPPAPTG